MTEKVCNNCRYFVEEDRYGEYSHEEAVKRGNGFCLMRDLFSNIKPDYPACNEYEEE